MGQKIGASKNYKVNIRPNPEDFRREAKHLAPEKRHQKLPQPGPYASVQSLVEVHEFEGAMRRFAWFFLSGKLQDPPKTFAQTLGLEDLPGLEGLVF